MKNLLVILMLISLSSFGKPLTTDNVRLELISQRVKYPIIVLAQSIEECGWNYESYNARKRNNLFGLWNSSKQRYFEFSDWTESVTFYKNRIQNRYKDGEDYFKFLKRIGYAESSTYISHVRWIYNKLKK